MNLPDTIILIFAASTNIFAVSIIAHIHKCLKGFDKLKVIAFFTLIPLLLYYAGTAITGLVQSFFPDLDRWMMLVVFLILGIRYILKAFKMKSEERLYDYTQWSVLLGLSIAIGMDYLILGLGFKFSNYNPQIVLILLLVFAILATLIGFIWGKKTGKFVWGNRMLYLGGLLFIGIALKGLIQLLGLV